MSASTNEIRSAVTAALEQSKDRKFKESVDMAIAIRDVDLSDPSTRFRAEVLMPHKLNKPVNICVIGDVAVVDRAKEAGIEYTLTEDEVEQLSKDGTEAVSFIEKIDYFLALPQLMATVGRLLGRYLGPRGKMPSVLPPGADFEDFVTRYGRTTRIRLRQNPVIHAHVGTEDMSIDEITENVRTILTEVRNRLEQGHNNIKHVHVKTTMGPAIKIGEV